MRLFQKLGAWITLVGLLLVMAGGIHVRGGPDGTWVHVNLVHAIGGVALFCGVVLSLVAASSGGGATTDREEAKESSK